MKRFIDTEMWKKLWYRKLSPAEKCAIHYLLSSCDNVGVWDVDQELADFCIGEAVDWDALAEKSNGNIEVLPNGKWWLVDFVRFQHPDLMSGSTSNACKSYVRLLQKHGLYNRFPELFEAFGSYSGSLSEGSKEKVRVKDKVEEGVKEGEAEERHRYGEYNHVLLTDHEYADLCRRYGPEIAERYIQRVDAYCETHGKTYQRWKSAVHTYIRNDVEKGKLKLDSVQCRPTKICKKCGKPYIGTACMKCGWSETDEENHGTV